MVALSGRCPRPAGGTTSPRSAPLGKGHRLGLPRETDLPTMMTTVGGTAPDSYDALTIGIKSFACSAVRQRGKRGLREDDGGANRRRVDETEDERKKRMGGQLKYELKYYLN